MPDTHRTTGITDVDWLDAKVLELSDRIEQLEADKVELERKLLVCSYEWDNVHNRLTLIRSKKDELIEIIDGPTGAEALEQEKPNG